MALGIFKFLSLASDAMHSQTKRHLEEEINHEFVPVLLLPERHTRKPCFSMGNLILSDETSSLPSDQNSKIYIHLPKTIEGIIPKVNYRLWVMMMHQCTFVNCNKHATLVKDADHGGEGACVGVGGMDRISMFSVFVANLKLL